MEMRANTKDEERWVSWNEVEDEWESVKDVRMGNEEGKSWGDADLQEAWMVKSGIRRDRKYWQIWRGGKVKENMGRKWQIEDKEAGQSLYIFYIYIYMGKNILPWLSQGEDGENLLQ